MTASERARIEEIIELVLRARTKLGPRGSFRARVLVDMVILELGKNLASLTGDEPG